MKNISLYIIILILLSIIIYQNSIQDEIQKTSTQSISANKIEKKDQKRVETTIESDIQQVFLTDDDAVLHAKKLLTLSRKDDFDVTIQWSIDTKSILLPNGDLNENVKLIATLSKNEVVDTKTFEFHIDKSLKKDDSLVESKTFKYLTSDFIKVDNESLEQTKSDLNLPEIGMDGGKIIWDSSHPNIISNKGIVIRPSFNQYDVEVILRAIIETNGEEQVKEFTVTVLADESEIREYKD